MDIYTKHCDHRMMRSKSCSLETIDIALGDPKVYTEKIMRSQMNRTASDSSIDIRIMNDSNTNTSGDFIYDMDSELTKTSSDGTLMIVDKKIESLYVMFHNQSKLLHELKEEITNSKTKMEQSEANKALAATLRKAFEQINIIKEIGTEDYMDSMDQDGVSNNRAKCLLDAIELRQSATIEREIKHALTNFLQSNELKEHIVSATVQSVKNLIQCNFSRDLRNLYLPVLERSHWRLLKHVTNLLENAFTEIEVKSGHKSKFLRRTQDAPCGGSVLEDPGRVLLDYLRKTLKEVFQNEMMEWRQELFEVFNDQIQEMEMEVSERDRAQTPASESGYSSVSPLQPANPNHSYVDLLMLSAEITKKIQDGDVNGAFEQALSSSDLSLVMVACRAADPDKLFESPDNLSQSVMLSLLQQLTTDMVHETQLKCRYLEEVILNLDKNNPGTRKYLPLVASEARAHLMKFLDAYPNHVANRRTTLIHMAAYHLIM